MTVVAIRDAAAAQEQLLLGFRESNARLRAWLDDFSREAHAWSVDAGHAIAGLTALLMHAGACLKQLPIDRDPALEAELSDYRRNVERLRGMLPMVHAMMLAERSRLERERERLQSAGEWMRGSQQTW